MAPRGTRHVGMALLLTGIVARAALAEIVMTPESPRWGDAFSITLDPSTSSTATARVTPADRLYAVLSTRHQLLGSPRERVWVPMTWDGKRFNATLTLRAGCETGYVSVVTAERSLSTSRSFVCRTPDGRVPPGAIATGLLVGGWDAANWNADLAADLAAMRAVPGHGWEYFPAWFVTWGKDRVLERLRAMIFRVLARSGDTATPR